MTPEQIKIRYEKKFINNEYMLKKRLNSFGLSFRELKIYYSEKIPFYLILIVLMKQF